MLHISLLRGERDMSNDSDCHGCIAKEGCILYWHKDCPCRSCLVKMVCGEACHIYYAFIDKIHPALKVRVS